MRLMRTHPCTSTDNPRTQAPRSCQRFGSNAGMAERAAARICRAAAMFLLTGVTAGTQPLQAQAPADSAALFNQARAERRQQHLQEFLFEHSDANGNLRPGSWINGIQNARSMSVVTSITLA